MEDVVRMFREGGPFMWPILVFGVFAMPQHPEADSEHAPLKTLHKRAHRRLVVVQAALNQDGVRIGHEPPGHWHR